MATDKPDGEPALDAASFASLVLMFGTTGLAHLGATPPPEGGEARVDLEAAKQVIDLLDMLRTKTTGNLTAGETELLDGILFDLRMRYLEAERAGGTRSVGSAQV